MRARGRRVVCRAGFGPWGGPVEEEGEEAQAQGVALFVEPV